MMDMVEDAEVKETVSIPGGPEEHVMMLEQGSGNAPWASEEGEDTGASPEH